MRSGSQVDSSHHMQLELGGGECVIAGDPHDQMQVVTVRHRDPHSFANGPHADPVLLQRPVQGGEATSSHGTDRSGTVLQVHADVPTSPAVSFSSDGNGVHDVEATNGSIAGIDVHTLVRDDVEDGVGGAVNLVAKMHVILANGHSEERIANDTAIPDNG